MPTRPILGPGLALAAALSPPIPSACPKGSAGRAPGPDAKARRKTRKAQKLARRQQR
jgi:hypothetical protein